MEFSFYVELVNTGGGRKQLKILQKVQFSTCFIYYKGNKVSKEATIFKFQA
jgi:hypothetical protein